MTLRFNKAKLRDRRRELRKNSTPSEKIMWEALRNRKLGVKFLRQYSIDGYVVDFFCPQQKLAIELEGKVHEAIQSKIYDKYRFRYLEEFGIRIIRFSNDEVTNNLELVLKLIKKSLSLPKRGIRQLAEGELKKGEL